MNRMSLYLPPVAKVVVVAAAVGDNSVAFGVVVGIDVGGGGRVVFGGDGIIFDGNGVVFGDSGCVAFGGGGREVFGGGGVVFVSGVDVGVVEAPSRLP